MLLQWADLSIKCSSYFAKCTWT